MGFDQLVSGVRQEGGEISDLGSIDFSGVTLYQAVFVSFPSTEGYFLSGNKLFVPNVGASINV